MTKADLGAPSRRPPLFSTSPSSHERLDMPNDTRRPHAKSRQGCAACRRRRIKCDEGKPKCRQCVRRNEPCIYPEPANSGASPVTPSNGLSTPAEARASVRPWSTPSPQLRLDDGPDKTFTLQDLQLLHHWTAHTSKSLAAGNPDVLRFWQEVFPEVRSLLGGLYWCSRIEPLPQLIQSPKTLLFVPLELTFSFILPDRFPAHVCTSWSSGSSRSSSSPPSAPWQIALGCCRRRVSQPPHQRLQERGG